jgi:putative nucleotidyltransferase with HDIG domain
VDELRARSNASGEGEKPDPELVLTHLDRLPTLSPIAVRLLQITTDGRSSAADVVRLLQADQSLTAKILSVAGSAWAGVSVPVTTLDKAVPLLGFGPIRSIVLAVSVFECLAGAGPGNGAYAFDRYEFWKHALAVACAARRLAEARRDLHVDPAEAFVAGLLHDLGKVALSTVFPKAYDRAAAHANHSRRDIADFERSVLGTDHTVAGRRLAERWHLPRELRDAIWLHHLGAETLPASVAKPMLVGVVQLADTLAREQRIGYSGNHMFYEHSPHVAERFNFTAQQIDHVVANLVGDVVAHAQILGLGEQAPEAVYLQAITRANTELGRLNTELSASSRKLAAGARYFRAISHFDQLLDATSDPPAVVAAMAAAAVVALQRPRVGAFGLREHHAAVDLCWVHDETGRGGRLAQRVPSDMQEWLSSPGDLASVAVTAAPPSLCRLLEPAFDDLGRATAWLVPVVHDQQLVGGVVFCSEADERGRLAPEADDLRSFVASLALALGRANAQVDARRLADDLAQTNRQLQQAQVELLRSRTLSMIAEMAAGAAHELNGPLTVISGRAQMLTQSLQAPDVQRALELIRGKAHECSAIVSALMDFARPRPPTLAPVSIPELLEEVRAEWSQHAELGDTALELEVRMTAPGAAPRRAADPLTIRGDRDQLRTVLNELISNAVDAVSTTGGSIAIRCQPSVTEGLVEISLRDTGCGMTPAVLQRAFDPFFSHRNAGRGRGLGLARAYRIIEGHGGRVWLESVAGEGTTAHVVLPRVPPAPADHGWQPPSS